MEPVPSIAKKPVTYDVYECTLESKYLERARLELNEEDYRRESAIAQMREFIAKHPRIQRCRTDAVFLLRFLRYRKFNVMDACEALEKYLTALQVSREFFSVDLQDPLIKECLCVPLGPNADGSMVFLIRNGHFNPESFKLEQLISLNFLALETYGYNEVLQVTGSTIVFDHSKTAMAHVAALTFPKIKLLMDATAHYLGARIKMIHVAQLPKFATAVVDLCVKALPSKLQQRVKVRYRRGFTLTVLHAMALSDTRN